MCERAWRALHARLFHTCIPHSLKDDTIRALHLKEVKMTEGPKILVTQKVPDPAYPLLTAIGEVDANIQEGSIWPYEELLRRGPNHDYIYSLLTDNIDDRFLAACAAGTPRLKMVANMVDGYNDIDVDAATRLGIAVSNTPGVLADTTADLAFALLMATARRIPKRSDTY